MTPNGGGQIRQCIELLHVAGPRDGEETGHGEQAGAGRRYAASAEGRRFLVSVPLDTPSTPITVVLNWEAGLKK